MGELPRASKPDRLDASAAERREPNWAEVEVIALSTRERHQTKERAKTLVNEAIYCQQFVQFIKELLARTDIVIDDDARRNFANVMDQLRAYHGSVRFQLRPPEDSAQALPRLIPEGAAQQLIDLSEPEDSLSEMESISRIDAALSRTTRPRIFSVSDSHVTTAYVMAHLREQRQPLHTVGVVSFDHHTDLRSVRGVAKKESVMTHVLEESGVGAVAVIGYDDSYAPPSSPRLRDQQLDRVTGAELYRNGRPDVQRFSRALEDIFADWRGRGITSVYTSVDLDGLRLPEQLYTATDYNPLDNIRGLLDLPADGPVRDRLRGGAAELPPAKAEEATLWLKNFLRAHQLTEYNGIPAAWVTRAMRLARDQFGLQLGVSRLGTEQRIVGDIVEYTPPDYQNRTARITTALLGSMAKAAS